MRKLQIIPTEIYADYKEKLKINISKQLNEIKDEDLTIINFNFYISLSSVSSSKIEGEEMDIDSYLKYKAKQAKYQKKLTAKIDDLFNAYIFAKNNNLNYRNFLKSHAIISKHFLDKEERGKLRTTTMVVADNNYKISFIAAKPDIVKDEIKKLFHDIKILINSKLSLPQIFYFASLIHLVFVTIHPMTDGNGRSARLLEKWFLATKLNEKGWFIKSELYYYKNLDAYYKNLEKKKKNYENVDYTKSISFILMLTNSLIDE